LPVSVASKGFTAEIAGWAAVGPKGVAPGCFAKEWTRLLFWSAWTNTLFGRVRKRLKKKGLSFCVLCKRAKRVRLKRDWLGRDETMGENSADSYYCQALLLMGIVRTTLAEVERFDGVGGIDRTCTATIHHADRAIERRFAVPRKEDTSRAEARHLHV